MTPLALTLVNFGSFIGTHVLQFPKGPGLFFMYGDNQAEPRLEGNGAGKSTVWKALTWLFYSKTATGMKAGDVSNWGVGKKTSVSLLYLDAIGNTCAVERCWSPNSWKCWIGHISNEHDLSKDTTNPVIATLKLDFAAFIQTVVMPQDKELFLDLKGDAQAALFSEVMGLDRWVKYSTRASDRARAEDVNLRRLERDQSRMFGSLETLRQTDVEEDLKAWEAERRWKIDSTVKDHKKLVETSMHLQAEYNKQFDMSENSGADLDVLAGDHKTSLFQLVTAKTRADEVRAQLRQDEAVLNERRGRTLALEGLRHCPTCGQGLQRDAYHVQHDMAAAVKQDQEALDERRAALDNTEIQLEGLKRTTDKAHVALQVALDQAVVITKRVTGLRSEIAQVNKTLDSLESTCSQLDAQVNPYARIRDDTDARVRRIQHDIAAQQKAVDEAQTRCSVSSAWVRWFKDIRLAQIGDALEQLEIEVNNQVTALGLLDWEIRFDIDRESKSGTVQRGFSVLVKSPANTKSVPWESWSGGERQRLLDAGQMGLSNLVRARTGCTFNLEAWDEPTKGMSQQGVQDLLEALHTRAHREQRQIWVVDHMTLGFNKFAGYCRVTKDLTGSHFRMHADPV